MSLERFFTLLARHPRIAPLWDPQQREMRVKALDEALGVMSPAEAQLARFFASVWQGHERNYPFDLIDAMSRLDTHGMQTIALWVADPFWP